MSKVPVKLPLIQSECDDFINLPDADGNYLFSFDKPLGNKEGIEDQAKYVYCAITNYEKLQQEKSRLVLFLKWFTSVSHFGYKYYPFPEPYVTIEPHTHGIHPCSEKMDWSTIMRSDILKFIPMFRSAWNRTVKEVS